MPILIGVSLLLFGFAFDGRTSVLDSMILFGGSIVYTVFAITRARKEASELDEDALTAAHPTRSVVFLIVG